MFSQVLAALPKFINTYGVDPTAVAVPVWLDFAAVVVGSFGGMLTAQQRRLDLIGYIGLALLCGLGGGLIRDTILGVGNVYMMQSPYAIPASIATGVIGFLFPTIALHFPHLLEWVDIFSVGLFAILGTDKPIVYHMWPMSCLLLGTITGVGGGMLRDVFLGDVPKIFQRSNLYAVCALAGSFVYYASVMWVHMGKSWAAALGVAVCVILRRVSLRYDIMSPADVNLAPHFRKPYDAVERRIRRAGRRRRR